MWKVHLPSLFFELGRRAHLSSDIRPWSLEEEVSGALLL